jgi:hypothetical protein
VAIWCLRLAGIYLQVGMSIGIGMGTAQSFALAAAHAHVNLLGWVTLALAALVFTVWQWTATTRMARAFFWLYNLALPPTMLALSLELLGNAQWMPVIIVGRLALFAAAILFVANVLVSQRGAPAAAAQSPAAGIHRPGAAHAEAR